MMINNNPYNLPERPPNKQNRIYTQTVTSPFRTQLTEGSAAYTQYKARPGISMNQVNSKNLLNAQQGNSPFRQPYQGIRNDVLHYVPSPKNNNSNGNAINNNFNTSNSKNRVNGNIASSCDKKQIGSLRESFGVSIFDIKQINQKIELITLNVKATEKRIGDLQKSNSNGFLPSNSKHNSEVQCTSTLTGSQLISKYQVQWTENLNRVKQQISNMKEQIRNNRNSNKYGMDIDRIISQKCREALESAKNFQNNHNFSRIGSEQIKKQIENVRVGLQDRLKKNFQFLTSVIGRIQRQLHTNLLIMQPNFKQSAIKCSTTAILLRFVECFKVRKHSAKNGQIKITLTDNTYYIDSQGYLLDKEQYYIIDSRECRVRLQEKHIRLLKEQSILM